MYCITVECFKKDIENGIFLNNLKKALGKDSFEGIGDIRSYEQLSKMLVGICNDVPDFKDVDIIFEYQPPNYAGFCDVVLIGKKDDVPAAYVIELKDWGNDGKCIPWANDSYHTFINYHGNPQKHPSAQVKCYVEACKYTHSAFVSPQGNIPKIIGSVFFTSMEKVCCASYRAKPFGKLTKSYPVFCNLENGALKKDILQLITSSDKQFKDAFANGSFVQSNDLKFRLKDSLRRFLYSDEKIDRRPPFDLRGKQDAAYQKIVTAIDNAMKNSSSPKKVFIIKGIPGSGKTAIAANLLLYALEQQTASQTCEGNIIFTSAPTNRDTWKKLFMDIPGIFQSSGNFNPGLTTDDMQQGGDLIQMFMENKPDLLYQDGKKTRLDPIKWRDIWKYLQSLPDFNCKIGKNEHLLTIVDEAHSLVKQVDEDSKPPKRLKYSRAGNWVSFGIGPQAYYIMYASKVSVFLMEEKQGVLDRETTKVADIRKWAKEEFGIECEEYELTEQFRCGGSVEYIQWVDRLFSDKPDANYLKWKDRFQTSVVDYPACMDDYLKEKRNNGKTVRLISSFSVEWKTENMSIESKARLLPNERDFYFHDGDGKGKPWGRCWNTRGEYIVPITNTNMQNDSLFEVGYPQEIRGWDFDYFGILWLDDLVWRNGKWCMPIQCNGRECSFIKVLDSAIESTRKAAEEQLKADIKSGMKIGEYVPYGLNEKVNDLFEKVFGIYRILLTRALEGNVLYVKDPETRAHIRELLK